MPRAVLLLGLGAGLGGSAASCGPDAATAPSTGPPSRPPAPSDGGATPGPDGSPPAPQPPGAAGITNPFVFVIAMENKGAGDIYGSASAPYINGTLVPRYARASGFADELPLAPRIW